MNKKIKNKAKIALLSYLEQLEGGKRALHGEYLLDYIRSMCHVIDTIEQSEKRNDDGDWAAEECE